MRTRAWTTFALAVGTLLGCASTAPVPSYQPGHIDPQTVLPKVSDFVVIFDDSASMGYKTNGTQNLITARELTSAMLKTVPELDYRGAVRTFGQGRCAGKGATSLAWGPEKFSAGAARGAIEKIDCRGGRSPLNAALDAAGDDLGRLPGRKAIFIVSDGLQMEDDEIASASLLGKRYGNLLCIYAIQIGDSASGRELLQAIVNAAECGRLVGYRDLATADSMGAFVRDALTEPDSDGDGVRDADDRCPDTPRGVKVDATGCPMDSDGDGVYDGVDQCPDTPRGTKVDERGCPIAAPEAPPAVEPAKAPLVLEGVNFASDEAALTPVSTATLEKVARSLREWPEVRVEIAGYADSTNTEAHNQKLSERRAKVVYDYLVAKGVDASRLTMKGYGESHPVADNGTVEGRAKNRRVELHQLP